MRIVERPQLVPPSATAHKYSRGMVVVIGGEMPGAAMLACGAAMRVAGYVVLVGGGGGPHALVHKPWEEIAHDHRIGALLIGPGLGRSADSRALLAAALESDHPLVLDGDALTIIGESGHAAFQKRAHPVILTPHEGEFSTLFPALSGSRAERAGAAAQISGAFIILKGAETVIAAPCGDVAVSPIASPWLASAGTGDVLAGIVAALLSTKIPPMEASLAAVWLHGEAARRAGPALIADDLAAHLPAAITECL